MDNHNAKALTTNPLHCSSYRKPGSPPRSVLSGTKPGSANTAKTIIYITKQPLTTPNSLTSGRPHHRTHGHHSRPLCGRATQKTEDPNRGKRPNLRPCDRNRHTLDPAGAEQNHHNRHSLRHPIRGRERRLPKVAAAAQRTRSPHSVRALGRSRGLLFGLRSEHDRPLTKILQLHEGGRAGGVMLLVRVCAGVQDYVVVKVQPHLALSRMMFTTGSGCGNGRAKVIVVKGMSSCRIRRCRGNRYGRTKYTHTY
ncbi:hypothetical protein GGR54DRAFT_392873 [Hypoxylon sp. NC1633]|nr:hypothetical protein GGR54DRAFT_392873 [Hypoxylon sp. NC1633]